MKNKLSLLAILLFIGSSAFSQSMTAWPELKNFHGVMSQTFHPSEEGNLEPIKTRATEMKEKAYALADSKIPAEFNNDKVKAAVNQLKEETSKMEKVVNSKGSDKEITAQLTTVHDTFHQIVGLCSPKSEGSEKENAEPSEQKK
jgi:hypothetical protein